MQNKKWYETSFKRNLIDMHIPDWNPEFFSKIDPQEYVSMLKKANVDTAYIYATSCVGLCNFPTKVGKMHEGLGGRDIIREITDGCRKEGIRPILYINIWSLWAYETFPDWRCKDPTGRESLEYMFGQPGRYGVLCPNSPYQEYVLSLVRELMENYETDGLWIDMILWRTMCTCHHCQERFKRETGHEIPKTVDLGNPVFMEYLHKRMEWMKEFFCNIKQVVHQKNPDAAVVCNSTYYPESVHGMSLEYAQEVEYITGDSNLGPVRSFEAKLFNNVTKNHPFEFLCSVMDPGLLEHSMLKTEEHLLQLMTSCLAHNGRNGFIDAIDPYGTLNPAVYARMESVYAELEKYRPFLEPNMEMCADVAIYTNFSSTYSPSDTGKPLYDNPVSDHMRATMAAAARFVEHNIPFDVITTLSLDKLSKFKVIVLADAYLLYDNEVEALREFVRNGGKLYASGRCAIYDGKGGKCSEGRLSDVLGVRIVGETSEQVTYMRPVGEKSLFHDYYTERHPMSCKTIQTLVETADDTEVFARLTLPIVHPEDTSKFASAISDPPGILTEYPSVTSHAFGNGQVIYSAGAIETLTGRDHSELFAKTLIGGLIGAEPTFVSDAPYPVEIVMYRQKESKNYVINVTNATLPILTIPDIEIQVRIPQTIKKMYTVPDCKEVLYSEKDGVIQIRLDKLRVFEMIIVETEN